MSDKDATTDAIKETLANIRQISTIRFVALPFFGAASAAIANALENPPWSKAPQLAWFGLGLATVGLSFEILLSRNLKCWWHALEPNLRVEPWRMVYAHRNPVAVWATRITLFAPYLASFFYWLTKLGLPKSDATIICFVLLAVAITVWVAANPDHMK